MNKRKTLKFNLFVVVVTLVIQAFLLFSPFIPITANFWHANTTQDFYNILDAFVGIELFLLTAAVTLILLKAAQDQQESFSDMKDALPLTVVKKLKDSAFYNHFRSAVEDAEHTVRIAYLAPYPPTEVPYKYRKKYYEEILELMKKRTEITFKRLIRASSHNEEWVAELLGELEGRPNVDISLLTRDLPQDQSMPLALSVQVVDDAKTWLVAIGAHENERDFRDLYIENVDVTTGMSDYYDRVWEVSQKLLIRGRLTPEGQAFLDGTAKH